MKIMLYFKGNTDGRVFPRYLGMARFYGRTDQVLLLPIPLNWIIIGFDHAMFFLRRGRAVRCPHCRKAI